MDRRHIGLASDQCIYIKARSVREIMGVSVALRPCAPGASIRDPSYPLDYAKIIQDRYRTNQVAIAIIHRITGQYANLGIKLSW